MLSYNLIATTFNSAVTSTGVSSTAFDLDNAAGDVLLIVNARTGGTADMTVTVQHSISGTGDWATVPAAAIISNTTGAASAFADISTTAYQQVRHVVRQQLRRFVRVTLAGTTVTHNVAISWVYTPTYTEIE
jgi:hypothetical protein